MKIEDIQRNFLIGSEVVITLLSGKERSGMLTGITQSSISLLQPAHNNPTLIAVEQIALVEESASLPHPESSPVSNVQHRATELLVLTEPIQSSSCALSQSPGHSAAEQSQSDLQAEQSQTDLQLPPQAPTHPPTDLVKLSSSPLSQASAYPQEIIVEVIKVSARLEGAIKQAKQTNLELLEPNFDVPDTVKSQLYSTKKNDIVNGWTRLKDKYTSAVKNDLSRLNHIVHEYESLAEKHSEIAASAYFNRGCLQFKIQQVKEALRSFEAAAIKYKEPRLFYNWAALALQQGSPDIACHALEEFFKQSSPSENLVCWHKFVELAIDHGIATRLIHLLEYPNISSNSSDCHLILESAVFILDSHQKTEDAYRVMALIQQSDFEFDQVIYLLESAFETLEIQSSAAYEKQKQSIADTTKRIKQAEVRNRAKKQTEFQISNAARFAKLENYSRAISELSEALRIDPENAQIQQRISEYREIQREKSLPKGTGLYSQAVRARRAGDLKKAIQWLREDLKRGSTERVANELAGVLLQDNQPEEAIKELKKYIQSKGESISILNSLVSCYQKAGIFKECVRVLEKLITLNPTKEIIILKQLAFSYFKEKNYDKTEEVLSRCLRLAPRDETAKRWLDGIRQARQKGFDPSSLDSLDKTFILQDSLTDLGTNISQFLYFHLDRGEYKGVYEAKIPNRDFSEEDLAKLRGLIESTGRNRPGQRAEFNLSAAKLLMDLKSEDERKIRSYLQDFSVDMGDASILGGKTTDVALSYYAEAFAVATKWHVQLEERFSRSIQIFCADNSEKIPSPIEALESALELKRIPVLMNWLFEISFNAIVADFLLSLIHSHDALCKEIQEQCYAALQEEGGISKDFQVLADLWGRSRETARQRTNEITRAFSYLTVLAENLGTLPDQSNQVQQLIDKFRALQTGRGKIELTRLNYISVILQSLLEYNQQQSYVEKESLANKIKWEIEKRLEEIKEDSTKYSVELFYPYLERLKEILEKHFIGVQQGAEPNGLKTELAGDPYIPQPDSNISCKITVSNQSGRSPVSEVVIYIESSENKDYTVATPDVRVTEPLAGGQKNTKEVIINVAEKAKQSQVFTLYYRLGFKTRTGKQIETDVQSLSVRLGREEDFEKIDNPYQVWASSSTVTDPQMFFGRDEMLNNLVSAISSSLGVKSLVIYGQKRAGKSSILYHLEQRLTMPIIPVRFSIGDIQGSDTADSQDGDVNGNESVSAFFYRVVYRIKSKFEALEEEGYPALNIEQPRFADIQQNPQPYFYEYMDNLKKALRREPRYKGAKLVLLIDEFTYIYSGIKRGSISPTFMSLWKAILQEGYFGSVLVGQDTMSQFLNNFPNELQVADKQRVSYLAQHDAHRLIDEPICMKIPGTSKTESRYKGDAIPRLTELTANSPYYIQIFCDRLVSYMNRKKLVRITDADVDKVRDELIKGTNSLDRNYFDNLISSDIDETNRISQDQSLTVLREIATGAPSRQSWCDSSKITVETAIPIGTILDDLVEREVLEKEGKSRYRIRVELFKYWLLANQ